MIVELIQNIALLVALSVGLQMIARRWEQRDFAYRLVAGFLFGVVAIAAMMTPLQMAPGLIYDGRSIILSLAGLMGGPVTAGIAALMAAAYRLYLGGVGAPVGVAVIVEAAALGAGYFYLRQQDARWLRPIRLWAFGVVVHLGMLGLQLLLPDGLGLQILRAIGLPVLVFYPLGLLLSAFVFLEAERRRTAEAQAVQSQRQMTHLLASSPAITYSLAPDFTPRWFSPNIQEILGYSLEEACQPDWWRNHLHPDDREAAIARSQEVLTSGHLIHKYRFLKRNGDVLWVRDELRLLQDEAGNPTEIVGSWSDITGRVMAERSLTCQNRILELIATGAPLETTLEALVEEMEAQLPGMLASILLLDENGLHIRHGAAPSLPESYWRAIDGEPIGQRAGSCGTAMYRGEAVIVEDIATDPLWERYRELALSHGLRACWSTPIFDEHGDVLGSFALYTRTPARPTPQQETVIAQATNLAAIAIARHRQEEALRRERDFALQVMENLGQGLTTTDENGRFTYVNPAYAAMVGYPVDRLLGRHPAVVTDEADHPKLEEALARRRAGETSTFEINLRHRDGHLVPVLITGVPRFHDGRYIGSIAVVTDISERKRAEEALRQSEERFRSLAESSLTGIYLIQDGRFAYVNQALATLFGHEVDEIVGRLSPLDLTAPHHRELVATHIRQRMEGAVEAVRYEFQGLRKDGSTIEVEVYERRILGEGKPSILGTVLDISDRKRREREMELVTTLGETLRASLTRREILPVLLDQLLLQLEVDGAAVEILVSEDGTLRVELARGIWAHLTDRQVPPGAGLSSLVLETGQPYLNNEAQKDPRLQYADITGSCRAIAGIPLVAEDKIIGLLWIGSQRLLGDEDLRLLQALANMAASALHRAALYEHNEAQARQMTQILRTVPQGVVVLDATGRILMANPVAVQDLATLANAGVGDVVTQLGDRTLKEVLTSPPTGIWHEVHAGARTFEVIARPIPNGPEPEQWVLLIDDVTRSRQIQAQIQQQERLATVGQLAAGIAHDFNNIITVIVLHAQMAMRSPGLSPRDRERMAIIDQQAHHATELIRQILDFSRQSVLERQAVNLLILVKEQAKLLERTLPESIQIRLGYEPGDYVLDADPTRLRQVLLNLVINARDAMPTGGHLTIELGHLTIGPSRESEQNVRPPLPGMAPGRWLLLRVRDTGTGIPDDVLGHIFEPFFTTKEPGKGTGLGLAQVHGIVSQHGGHIDVESQVGKGTTFTIYLPALPEPEHPIAADEAQILPQGQGETILLVEDNLALRTALRENLEQWGYRVLEAAHGREALGILDRADTAIDVILTDMVMPEMGGVALLHVLRQRGWTRPIILMSGHPREAESTDLAEYGISTWLPKPLPMAQLAQTLADLLQRRDGTPSADSGQV